MTDEEKINGILRHIKKVEDNCNRLASKLEDRKFAKELIIRGRLHDASKLQDFEFNNLNEESGLFKLALRLHHQKNSHHPEYYEYIQKRDKIIFFSDPSNEGKEWKDDKGIWIMNELDLAEMVCDCLARSQEFGSDVRDWFFNVAPNKYGYSDGDRIWLSIDKYLGLLLTPKFKK